MFRQLYRPLLLLLAVGLWIAVQSPAVPARASQQASLGESLAQALAAMGWSTRASDIHWVDRPRGGLRALWAGPRAVVLAHRSDEPADVLLVRTRLTPEGRLLSVSGVNNLSDTTSVDESQLQVRNERAVWAVNVGSDAIAIHSAQLSRADELPRSEFGWLARLQMHLTWQQETGQFAGIQKHEYRIEPSAKQLRLLLGDSTIAGNADGDLFQISHERVEQATTRLTAVTSTYGHPGNIVTWAVDRVRALPWVGSDRVQLLKTIAFDVLDRLERAHGTITADNGLNSLNEEVGHVLDAAGEQATDPESGWPPASMKPVLKDPLPREGQWSELDGDPFVARQSQVAPPFLFSFIRTDRERAYTKVFVVLWDPRHLDLHMMSGTREPKTATGETGSGEVPRDPETLASFVGAFNGGFQATHGEFGMMADSVVYLPPKPFAATVARMSDGSTGFGTWPNDEAIPESIVSFRQNLTPLVMDDKVNPYQRSWWGGVPPGWEDATRTVRTGLCLTQEGFAGYFYGSSIDATHLALAMQGARCQYGLQLDMNPGHTGFEFYRVGKKSSLPELGRKLDNQWEARGEVPGNAQWEFMGRRMIRYMNLMHFPRYVRTQSRDFFYLTERRLLPLPPLETRCTPKEPNEGTWNTRGIEQKGWPPAIATTRIRPDPTRPQTRVSLIAIDPRWLAQARSSDGAAQSVLSIEPNEHVTRSSSVWLDESGMQLSEAAPASGALRLASGMLSSTPSARTSAAIGELPGRIWVYAEVASGPDSTRDGKMLEGLLLQLNAKRILYFGHPLNIKLGSSPSTINLAVRLIRRDGPRGVRIFQQTPIVPPKEWMPLQDKRVRYQREKKPPPFDNLRPETSESPTDSE